MICFPEPGALEGRRELSRGVSEANPRNIAINECAPAGARGAPATPAGVRIVVLFYPGVRFAHPRLISLRPAGAESLRAADPCREGLPLRIVLRRPVLAAGMEGDTTRLGRQRHREQPAREGVPGHHEPQGCFEIAARFLFVPGRAPGCERLQTEGCSLRMTHEAP